MKLYRPNQLVTVYGQIYFVEEVLEEGEDPLYLLRRTVSKYIPSFRVKVYHSQLEGHDEGRHYRQMPLPKTEEEV